MSRGKLEEYNTKVREIISKVRSFEKNKITGFRNTRNIAFCGINFPYISGAAKISYP